MTADEIIELASRLPGVVAFTPGEADGVPEVAWGDTFFFYDPDDSPANRRMPFATIVIKNYDGFDTASNLNRPGVFRLNISIGRKLFEELIGHPPADHASHAADFDYTALDRLLPHPAYATQAWVCVLNPGDATAAQAQSLLTEAYRRAVGPRRATPR